MERPGKWKEKRIDDPEAITAYLNFARDIIQRFRPSYFNYAVEANMLKDKDQWPQLVNALRQIYTTLKSENQKLPIFISIQIDEFWKDEKNQREFVKQLLPYTDYIAISSYPYFYGYFDPATIPKNYFSAVAALAPNKPFAVAETGFIAKDFDAFGLRGAGSEAWQDQYVNFLLTESNKLKARFVMWYVPMDYDYKLDKIKSFFSTSSEGKTIVDVFKVWLNAGLLDGEGRARPAFQTWTSWLKIPRK